MSQPDPSLSINVDVTNPGQFFACCGLLELAHRLWPGAEGWFDGDGGKFHIHAPTDDGGTFQRITKMLTNAGIEGELSNNERKELKDLESKKRKQELPESEEERRKSLGKRQREGSLSIGDPFKLRVAWWQEEGDDVPKTFAGRQEVLRMALAMLSKVDEAVNDNRPLDVRCLLQAAGNGRRQADTKVEPLYFDAVRFAHALDVGFSLDVQEKTIRASAAPLTEMLALIGLQRFRPRQSVESKWAFEYWTWPRPLCAPVATAVACGAVPAPRRQGYRFTLQFRDDQKRYKAFGFATPIGGDA